MSTVYRVDQYREPTSASVPDSAENNTALPDPEAETSNASDAIDTDPADQANPAVPDRDS